MKRRSCCARARRTSTITDAGTLGSWTARTVLQVNQQGAWTLLGTPPPPRPSQRHVAIAHRDDAGGTAVYGIGVAVEVGGDSAADFRSQRSVGVLVSCYGFDDKLDG